MIRETQRDWHERGCQAVSVQKLAECRRAVSADELMASLEISRATLKRHIATLRDLLPYGADVEVLAPPDLRSRIKWALHEAVGRYV